MTSRRGWELPRNVRETTVEAVRGGLHLRHRGRRTEQTVVLEEQLEASNFLLSKPNGGPAPACSVAAHERSASRLLKKRKRKRARRSDMRSSFIREPNSPRLGPVPTPNKRSAVSMHVYIHRRGECGLPSYHPRRQPPDAWDARGVSAAQETAKHRMRPPFLTDECAARPPRCLKKPE